MVGFSKCESTIELFETIFEYIKIDTADCIKIKTETQHKFIYNSVFKWFGYHLHLKHALYNNQNRWDV